MLKLDVERLEVTSFETSENADFAIAYPYTQNDPRCYSPWCVPTMVGPNCDTATNPI